MSHLHVYNLIQVFFSLIFFYLWLITSFPFPFLTLFNGDIFSKLNNKCQPIVQKKYLLLVGLVFWHDLFKVMLTRSSFDTVVPHSSTDKRWSWVLMKLQHDQRSLSQVSNMLQVRCLSLAFLWSCKGNLKECMILDCHTCIICQTQNSKSGLQTPIH